MMEMFYIYVSNMVATSHVWLLRTRNVVNTVWKLYFLFYLTLIHLSSYLNSDMWLLANVRDSAP